MREQEHCAHCRRPTLHELDAPAVNHVLHLLLTLCGCGCWAPVWLLLAISAPARQMRCLTCGHAVGEPTAAELARDAAQAKERAIARGKALSAATQATGAVVSGIAGTAARGLGAVFSSMWSGIVATVQQVDGLVVRLAGDDAFMAWFFRVVLLVLMLAIGTAGLMAAVRLWAAM